MPVKMSGKEFNEFYNSDWGDDVWVDDDDVTVDGRDLQELSNEEQEVPDTAVVVIKAGVLYMGGSNEVVGGLVQFARKWKKDQLVTKAVCEIPKDRYDEFVKAVLAAGGKVLV